VRGDAGPQMEAVPAAGASVLCPMGEVLAVDETERIIRECVNASCTCGGGPPEACCAACEVWHYFIRCYPRPTPGARMTWAPCAAL
jgi:hypothetical protein